MTVFSKKLIIFVYKIRDYEKSSRHWFYRIGWKTTN